MVSCKQICSIQTNVIFSLSEFTLMGQTSLSCSSSWFHSNLNFFYKRQGHCLGIYSLSDNDIIYEVIQSIMGWEILLNFEFFISLKKLDAEAGGLCQLARGNLVIHCVCSENKDLENVFNCRIFVTMFLANDADFLCLKS